MARKNLFIIFVALTLMLAYSGSAFAIYKWVDEKGLLHISDQPRPGKPQAEEPSEKDTAGKATVRNSRGQSPDAGSTPTTVEQPKLTTSPVATALPPKKEQAVASQPSPSQQLQAAVTTTNTVTAASPAPAPATPGREAARNIPSNAPRTTAPDNPAAAGMSAAVLSIMLVALVLGYVYFSLCLFLIARKLNVSAPWVAWIPIAQVWTLLKAAGKPCWWVLLLLIPLVNLIVHIYLWMCIVENLGRDKWLGLLMLVPIVNLVYLGILAFSGSDGSSNSAEVEADGEPPSS